MDTLFIFGANHLFLVALFLATGYFLTLPRQDKKRMVIVGCITLPLTYLVAVVVRHLHYDPRPFVAENFTPLIEHAADNGFPSDHTLLLAAVAAVFYPFARRKSYVLWAIALLVGISRVYVGVHHSTDIIASIGIAILVLAIVYPLLKKKFSWPAPRRT